MKQIQKQKMFLLFTENQVLFSWGGRNLGNKKFQREKMGFIPFSQAFTMLSEGAKVPLGKIAGIELDSLTFSLYFYFLGLPTADLYSQLQHHLIRSGLGSMYPYYLTTKNGSRLKPRSIRKQLKSAESKASLSSGQHWQAQWNRDQSMHLTICQPPFLASD